MTLRRVAAGLVGLALLITACTVSSVEVTEEVRKVDEEPNLDTAAADAEPTAEPTPEPEIGPCGPVALPAPGATSWPIPTQPTLSQKAIDELATMAPSTSFDVTVPVVALDFEDQSLKYVLGPAWPLEVEQAQGTDVAGVGCSINVTFTESGLGALNQIAAACFVSEPQCPLQRLALVVDDEVIFHPTIQSPQFTEPTIVITSASAYPFDETPQLAQAIADGAQFRPVLVGPIVS